MKHLTLKAVELRSVRICQYVSPETGDAGVKASRFGTHAAPATLSASPGTAPTASLGITSAAVVLDGRLLPLTAAVAAYCRMVGVSAAAAPLPRPSTAAGAERCSAGCRTPAAGPARPLPPPAGLLSGLAGAAAAAASMPGTSRLAAAGSSVGGRPARYCREEMPAVMAKLPGAGAGIAAAAGWQLGCCDAATAAAAVVPGCAAAADASDWRLRGTDICAGAAAQAGWLLGR